MDKRDKPGYPPRRLANHEKFFVMAQRLPNLRSCLRVLRHDAEDHYGRHMSDAASGFKFQDAKYRFSRLLWDIRDIQFWERGIIGEGLSKLVKRTCHAFFLCIRQPKEDIGWFDTSGLRIGELFQRIQMRGGLLIHGLGSTCLKIFCGSSYCHFLKFHRFLEIHQAFCSHLCRVSSIL